MANTTESKVEALTALASAIQCYIQQNACASGFIGLWPRIDPGHQVHQAVCRVEKMYPDGRLPHPALMTWIELVQRSRATGVKRSPTKRQKLRFNCMTDGTFEAGLAASSLLTWTQQEIQRAAAAEPPPRRGRRVQIVGSGLAARIEIDGVPLATTDGQRDVLVALVDAGAAGLALSELIDRSGRGGARNILRGLMRLDPWRGVIHPAGRRGGAYRID